MMTEAGTISIILPINKKKDSVAQSLDSFFTADMQSPLYTLSLENENNSIKFSFIASDVQEKFKKVSFATALNMAFKAMQTALHFFSICEQRFFDKEQTAEEGKSTVFNQMRSGFSQFIQHITTIVCNTLNNGDMNGVLSIVDRTSALMPIQLLINQYQWLLQSEKDKKTKITASAYFVNSHYQALTKIESAILKKYQASSQITKQRVVDFVDKKGNPPLIHFFKRHDHKAITEFREKEDRKQWLASNAQLLDLDKANDLLFYCWRSSKFHLLITLLNEADRLHQVINHRNRKERLTLLGFMIRNIDVTALSDVKFLIEKLDESYPSQETKKQVLKDKSDEKGDIKASILDVTPVKAVDGENDENGVIVKPADIIKLDKKSFGKKLTAGNIKDFIETISKTDIHNKKTDERELFFDKVMAILNAIEDKSIITKLIFPDRETPRTFCFLVFAYLPLDLVQKFMLFVSSKGLKQDFSDYFIGDVKSLMIAIDSNPDLKGAKTQLKTITDLKQCVGPLLNFWWDPDKEYGETEYEKDFKGHHTLEKFDNLLLNLLFKKANYRESQPRENKESLLLSRLKKHLPYEHRYLSMGKFKLASKIVWKKFNESYLKEYLSHKKKLDGLYQYIVNCYRYNCLDSRALMFLDKRSTITLIKSIISFEIIDPKLVPESHNAVIEVIKSKNISLDDFGGLACIKHYINNLNSLKLIYTLFPDNINNILGGYKQTEMANVDAKARGHHNVIWSLLKAKYTGQKPIKPSQDDFDSIIKCFLVLFNEDDVPGLLTWLVKFDSLIVFNYCYSMKEALMHNSDSKRRHSQRSPMIILLDKIMNSKKATNINFKTYGLFLEALKYFLVKSASSDRIKKRDQFISFITELFDNIPYKNGDWFYPVIKKQYNRGKLSDFSTRCKKFEQHFRESEREVVSKMIKSFIIEAQENDDADLTKKENANIEAVDRDLSFIITKLSEKFLSEQDLSSRAPSAPETPRTPRTSRTTRTTRTTRATRVPSAPPKTFTESEDTTAVGFVGYQPSIFVSPQGDGQSMIPLADAVSGQYQPKSNAGRQQPDDSQDRKPRHYNTALLTKTPL